MAQSYTEIFTLALDPDFTKRLAVAVADVGDEVYGEGSGVPNHDLRMAMLAYAGPTLSAYRAFAQDLALALLTLNQDMNESVTDAQLKSAVEQIWTPYALLLEARGLIEVAQA